MRKKIFLTSLLLATGAFVLASCGNKKVDSNNSESNNSTETNGGENQNQQENSNGSFFEEDAFVLPEDFNEKKLKQADLSLKQQILLDQHNYDLTSFEGTAYYSQGIASNGSVYYPSASITVASNLYSNDVFENKIDYLFDDDNMPGSNSAIPSLPVKADKELKVLKATDTAVKASNSYFRFGPEYSYTSSEKIALTENYSFKNENRAYGNEKYNYFNVGESDDYDLESRLYQSIPQLPMSYHYMSNYTYYQYDETHIVAVSSYSDSYTDSIPVKYDSNTGTTTFETYYASMNQKTITVFEINGNSFDLVFGCDYFEEKASHIYDQEAEIGISLNGVKPTMTFKSYMKLSSKEVEYDDEDKDSFINSFKANIESCQVKTNYYVNQLDTSGNLVIGDLDGSYSAKFNFLSEKDGEYNFECSLEVGKGDAANLKATLNYNLLNEKVLDDVALSSSESKYTTLSGEFVLDVDSKDLPDDVEIVESNGQKYLIGKQEDYIHYYAIVFNVSASVNDKNEIEVKVNGVEFIELEDTYLK